MNKRKLKELETLHSQNVLQTLKKPFIDANSYLDTKSSSTSSNDNSKINELIIKVLNIDKVCDKKRTLKNCDDNPNCIHNLGQKAFDTDIDDYINTYLIDKIKINNNNNNNNKNSNNKTTTTTTTTTTPPTKSATGIDVTKENIVHKNENNIQTKENINKNNNNNSILNNTSIKDNNNSNIENTESKKENIVGNNSNNNILNNTTIKDNNLGNLDIAESKKEINNDHVDNNTIKKDHHVDTEKNIHENNKPTKETSSIEATTTTNTTIKDNMDIDTEKVKKEQEKYISIDDSFEKVKEDDDNQQEQKQQEQQNNNNDKDDEIEIKEEKKT